MWNARGPRCAASPPQLSDIRMDVADVLFLGVQPDGTTLFAVSLEAHMMAALGTAAERFDPLVDLRSLALQGQLTAEEIAIAGQAPCPCGLARDTPVLWQMRLADTRAGRRLAPRLPGLRPDAFPPLGPRRDHGGAAR